MWASVYVVDNFKYLSWSATGCTNLVLTTLSIPPSMIVTGPGLRLREEVSEVIPLWLGTKLNGGVLTIKRAVWLVRWMKNFRRHYG